MAALQSEYLKFTEYQLWLQAIYSKIAEVTSAPHDNIKALFVVLIAQLSVDRWPRASDSSQQFQIVAK